MCSCTTGICILKTVMSFLLLSINFKDPPSFYAINELHERPRPILWFLHSSILCLIRSSRKGVNKYCCLSSSIPRPESIISICSILLNWNYLVSSDCLSYFSIDLTCWILLFGNFYNLSIKTMSPLLQLYLILFYIKLNITSLNLVQSALKSILSLSKFLKMWTFISLFSICN